MATGIPICNKLTIRGNKHISIATLHGCYHDKLSNIVFSEKILFTNEFESLFKDKDVFFYYY